MFLIEESGLYHRQTITVIGINNDRSNRADTVVEKV
jgi:hypothetical protein